MRWALLACVALGTMGCAEPFELTIGSGFTPEERQVIEERAHEWLSTGASIGRVRVERMSPDADLKWGGRYEDGVVRIHPAIAGERFSTLVLHEFGHAAGAGHHEGFGVMRFALDDSAPCITPADLALVGIDGPGTCGGDDG